MNSKLTNVETNNSSLESRLTEIEKKLTSIGQIREDFDKVNPKFKGELEIKTVLKKTRIARC